MIPIWGFGAAVNTLVSNLMGQKKLDEVMPVIYKTLILCSGFIIIPVIFTFIAPELWIKLYTSDISIIEDCILNHGSSSKPKTQEGKIFQLADKLSIFYPEFVKQLIELEKQEAILSDDEILKKINKKLKKYLEIFSDKEYQEIAREKYEIGKNILEN